MRLAPASAWRAAGETTLSPGALQIRDAAGNIWRNISEIRLEAVTPYGGGGGGGGGGSGDGKPAPSHASGDGEEGAEYETLTLELPVACLVHSGGKSLHAIVRIDAGNYDEYRKRVDYLYEVCTKNGMDIDRQNRTPSRLSRMPSIVA